MAEDYLTKTARLMASELSAGDDLELITIFRGHLARVHRRALRLCKDKKTSAIVQKMFETPEEVK